MTPEEIMNENRHDRVVDPVCGMRIKPEKAAGTIVHEGRTYFFCTEACQRQFEREPDRYVGSTR
jgi:Cu+-exporting ATPase